MHIMYEGNRKPQAHTDRGKISLNRKDNLAALMFLGELKLMVSSV